MKFQTFWKVIWRCIRNIFGMPYLRVHTLSEIWCNNRSLWQKWSAISSERTSFLLLLFHILTDEHWPWQLYSPYPNQEEEDPISVCLSPNLCSYKRFAHLCSSINLFATPSLTALYSRRSCLRAQVPGLLVCWCMVSLSDWLEPDKLIWWMWDHLPDFWRTSTANSMIQGLFVKWNHTWFYTLPENQRCPCKQCGRRGPRLQVKKQNPFCVDTGQASPYNHFCGRGVTLSIF